MSQLKPNNQKQRSRFAAWSFIVLGGFLLLIASVPALLILLGGAIGGAVGGGLLGLLGTLGISLVLRGRRMIAEDAASLLQRDQSPPIIYLRPFSEDGVIPRQSLLSRINSRERIKFTVWTSSKYSTYEERIAAALKRVAPFVAIGQPGEKLPQIGAARLYLDNAGWQERVTELVTQSGLVLIHIGQSDGLIWETQLAVKTLKPEQLILCLPIADKSGNQARQEKFNIFRAKTLALFPQPLPKDIGDALFLYFDKDWNSHLLLSHKLVRIPPLLTDETSTRDLQLDALKRLNLEFMRVSTPIWLRGIFLMIVVTILWLLILFVTFRFVL